MGSLARRCSASTPVSKSRSCSGTSSTVGGDRAQHERPCRSLVRRPRTAPRIQTCPIGCVAAFVGNNSIHRRSQRPPSRAIGVFGGGRKGGCNGSAALASCSAFRRFVMPAYGDTRWARYHSSLQGASTNNCDRGDRPFGGTLSCRHYCLWSGTALPVRTSHETSAAIRCVYPSRRPDPWTDQMAHVNMSRPVRPACHPTRDTRYN